MTGLRARATLLIALLVIIVCGGVWRAAKTDAASVIDFDILTLLPPTERNAGIERAAERLGGFMGNRIVFLVGHDDEASAIGAARAFAAALRQSGVVRHVQEVAPPFDPAWLTELYQPHRFALLSASDREAMQVGTFDPRSRLRAKLHSPIAYGGVTALDADPFGTLESWLAALPVGAHRVRAENGRLVVREAGKLWVLMSAELRGSAHDASVQNDTVQAVTRAEATMRGSVSDAELVRAGTLFQADAARASAKRDIDLIGMGSVAGIVMMLLVVFRSPLPILLGLISVGMGLVAACAISIIIHGKLHLLTLVFGASLIGEAIDYSIQYFVAHIGTEDEASEAGLRRVISPLTVALATSLVGYGALMLTPFPAAHQIALFAFCGLAVAWAVVVMAFPAWLRRASWRERRGILIAPQRMLAWWRSRVDARRGWTIVVLVLAACAPGFALLSFDDDIRQLIRRDPDLARQEATILRVTGVPGGSQFYYIEGADEDQVLEREERLTLRLRALVAQGTLGGYQAISDFLPSVARQGENRELLHRSLFSAPAATAAILTTEGLREALVSDFLAAFNATPVPLALDRWLSSPLSAPLRHLWLGRTAQGYASVVLPRGEFDVTSAANAASGLDGVWFVDKPASISRLFGEYRRWGSLWLLAAAAIVWFVLCLRYGWRDGTVVLLPTLLAMQAAISIFGYLGVSLTLFNLMGLLLVLGVGVNYAIFMHEGGERMPSMVIGVALSAATTLLSFGLLAASSVPALQGFGLTLGVGVGVAVLLTPLVLSFRRGAW